MKGKKIVPVRGFLLHITHYDPDWYKLKSKEKPFDLDLGIEIVEEIKKVGLNLLIIDCADGIRYNSHPELARRYTLPPSYLKKLVKYAKENGIEVVPKLNFSQSRYHHHNDWFYPYNELFDNPQYWQIAFDIIDELIEICQPQRYFHIGMDEDHDRAISQYINAIKTLRKHLKQRKLKTLMWNDSAQSKRALVHAEKVMYALDNIPKDVVQILWDYNNVQPKIIKQLVEKKFEVWVAPGKEVEQVIKWKKLLLSSGGKGLIMTTWVATSQSNRKEIISLIRKVGPIYTREENL
ncbi:MAG: hypothetical protein NC820_04865 [Candidatus Omnitrophica bacterium]|nr:hypothetical protein [Candidatus Omnitrophota bacterium]